MSKIKVIEQKPLDYNISQTFDQKDPSELI